MAETPSAFLPLTGLAPAEFDDLSPGFEAAAAVFRAAHHVASVTRYATRSGLVSVDA